MGLFDVLGSIAVAGMDSALSNENFIMATALSENGDRKLNNLMNSRQSLARTLDNRRYSQRCNRSNTSAEPLTGKQVAMGLGVLAVVGIGAALLCNSNDEKKNNNDSNSSNGATSTTASRKTT